MKQLIFLLLIFSATYTNGQSCDPAYTSLTKKADSLYQSQQFSLAASTGEQAYMLCNACTGAEKLYQTAASFARAGDQEKAFAFLGKSAERGYHRFDHIMQDPDMRTLETDQRWTALTESIRTNQKTYLEAYRPLLADELERINESDQSIRNEAFQNSGEPEESQIRRMVQTDSINLARIKVILDSCGWLGAHQVGRRGNTALFLVIQHADLPTQEKYLPMMRDAVSRNLANLDELALLEDRVLMGKQQPQIYGSQLRYDQETGELFLWPVANFDQLDERRACAGLMPIGEYMTQFNIIWDPVAYKAGLPELIRKTIKQE